MSIERELLKEAMYVIGEYTEDAQERTEILIAHIKKVLAQPEQTEQEPAAWIIQTEIYGKLSEWVCTDKKHYLEEHDSIKEPIPLYLAPQTHKPITGKEISHAFKADDEATHPYSYWAGVDFAEKHHGIGVDDE